jgi:hypothetical protein
VLPPDVLPPDVLPPDVLPPDVLPPDEVLELVLPELSVLFVLAVPGDVTLDLVPELSLELDVLLPVLDLLLVALDLVPLDLVLDDVELPVELPVLLVSSSSSSPPPSLMLNVPSIVTLAVLLSSSSWLTCISSTSMPVPSTKTSALAPTAGEILYDCENLSSSAAAEVVRDVELPVVADDAPLDLLLDLLPVVPSSESVLEDEDVLFDLSVVDLLLPVVDSVSSVELSPVTRFSTVSPASSSAFLADSPALSRAFPASSTGSLSLPSLFDDTWALALKTGATAKPAMAKPTSAVSIRYFTFVESISAGLGA